MEVEWVHIREGESMMEVEWVNHTRYNLEDLRSLYLHMKNEQEKWAHSRTKSRFIFVEMKSKGHFSMKEGVLSRVYDYRNDVVLILRSPEAVPSMTGLEQLNGLSSGYVSSETLVDLAGIFYHLINHHHSSRYFNAVNIQQKVDKWSQRELRFGDPVLGYQEIAAREVALIKLAKAEAEQRRFQARINKETARRDSQIYLARKYQESADKAETALQRKVRAKEAKRGS